MTRSFGFSGLHFHDNWKRAEYRRLVDGIAARLPHASMGSDLIAGFPGETDEDAAATEALVEALPFSYLHVFAYSDRIIALHQGKVLADAAPAVIQTDQRVIDTVIGRKVRPR